MPKWNSKAYRKHLAKTGNTGDRGRPLNLIARELWDGRFTPKRTEDKTKYNRKRWDYNKSTIVED